MRSRGQSKLASNYTRHTVFAITAVTFSMRTAYVWTADVMSCVTVTKASCGELRDVVLIGVFRVGDFATFVAVQTTTLVRSF